MNERIKQLANIWANRRAEDEKLGIVYTFSEPALEQFAELIVQECAEFANNHNEEIEGVTLGVGQALKNYFGVE